MYSREQKIIKDTSPPVVSSIQKELERLGPIIDYLIPLTSANVNKNIKTSEQMKNKQYISNLWNDVPKGHATQRSIYQFHRMKVSPIIKAIRDKDFEKLKSLNVGAYPFSDIYTVYSDNPDESYPLEEAVSRFESKDDVKIIKLLIDKDRYTRGVTKSLTDEQRKVKNRALKIIEKYDE